MPVTQAQFEAIKVCRSVYFDTPNGRRVLGHTLQSMGTFQDPEELLAVAMNRPHVLRDFANGFLILRDLGVWLPDNFGNLIEAMSKLPMPDIDKENRENGETR